MMMVENHRMMVENHRIDGATHRDTSDDIDISFGLYGENEDILRERPRGVGSRRDWSAWNRYDDFRYNKTKINDVHWTEEMERYAVIRKCFEEKGCPYFVATDGGSFTKEHNDENRGV